MQVYRLEISTGERWFVEWQPTLVLGKQRMRQIAKDLPHAEQHLDLVDIPRGREALCEALNNASGSRMNWPGEEVARIGTKKGAARRGR